jgi:tetratricopeptide (TPR) repeat protein
MKDHELPLVKVPTQNLEAYTLFLKGLHYYNKITPQEARKAIECFEKAILLEPAYGQAYAMAASCYAYLGGSGQMQPDKAFKIVHQYSDKAIQLDDSLAAGHVAKGSAYLLYDWNWKEAYKSLRKAIELNPATTNAHQMLCYYYMSTGQKHEAVEIMETAYKADPLSPIVNKTLTDAYLNAGRTDDALKQVELFIDMHPQMAVAWECKGWCTGVKGDWKKAVEIFEEVHRSFVKHPLKGLYALGCAYARSGEVEKALECIRKTEQRQAEEPGLVLDADLAMMWFSLGDADKGFHYLFQAVEKGMGPVAMIMEHPMFGVPADDKRFLLLKEKLKLA